MSAFGLASSVEMHRLVLRMQSAAAVATTELQLDIGREQSHDDLSSNWIGNNLEKRMIDMHPSFSCDFAFRFTLCVIAIIIVPPVFSSYAML